MSKQKTKPIVIWEQVFTKDAETRLQAAFNLIFGVFSTNTLVDDGFDSLLSFKHHVHD